ncbi:outer membrane protein assembly factor BamB family protein [Cellulomonas sp. P5_C5]
MSRRDTLATVELVEDVDDVPDAPVRSRRRWWLLAIPVVAALLVAGVQLVADALESAADARVAALPGAVDPLGDHADVLWRADLGIGSLADGLVARDALHGVLVGRDGSLSYDALDLSTGERLWSAPLSGADPAQTDPTYPRATVCEPDAEPGAEPERVVCLVTDGAAPFTRDPRPATRSRVVVLDLADGHVLADRPAPYVSSFAVLPGLTATAVVEDRHIVVVAADPLTGKELWRYRHAEASDQEPAISAGGGVIVAFGTPGGPVVLSASGDLVPAEPGTTGWGTTQEGWFVTERSDPAGQLRRVVRPGEPPVEVVGRLLDRRVDDGSVPGLEVSTGGLTFGWDARTGKRLWEADVSVSPEDDGAVLIIDGTAFLCSDDAVVALDARTGETRWTAPRQQGDYVGELLTDGAHVLLVEAPQDGASTAFVTVLDRRDGELVRRLALPAGVTSVSAAGRHLVDTSRRGAVARIG